MAVISSALTSEIVRRVSQLSAPLVRGDRPPSRTGEYLCDFVQNFSSRRLPVTTRKPRSRRFIPCIEAPMVTLLAKMASLETFPTKTTFRRTIKPDRIKFVANSPVATEFLGKVRVFWQARIFWAEPGLLCQSRGAPFT